MKELGLNKISFSQYGLRHAGASHDLLTKQRTHMEVKERLRHKSDSSMRRYAKAAHTISTANLVSPEVLKFGETVFANLESVFARRTQPFRLAGFY